MPELMNCLSPVDRRRGENERRQEDIAYNTVYDYRRYLRTTHLPLSPPHHRAVDQKASGRSKIPHASARKVANHFQLPRRIHNTGNTCAAISVLMLKKRDQMALM